MSRKLAPATLIGYHPTQSELNMHTVLGDHYQMAGYEQPDSDHRQPIQAFT